MVSLEKKEDKYITSYRRNYVFTKLRPFYIKPNTINKKEGEVSFKLHPLFI
jgi:hypothetical protein